MASCESGVAVCGFCDVRQLTVMDIHLLCVCIELLAVFMCTPQGRFKCDQRLCLSMSDFHPETWNPLWSVSAVLTGLLSFMLGEEDTVGSIQTTIAEKRAFAIASHSYNRSDKTFKELFPEFVRSPQVQTVQTESSSGRSLSGASSMRRERRIDTEGESLLSLLAWLVVFLAVIFGVFRMITRPV